MVGIVASYAEYPADWKTLRRTKNGQRRSGWGGNDELGTTHDD
jgi:hypothetical protein